MGVPIILYPPANLSPIFCHTHHAVAQPDVCNGEGTVPKIGPPDLSERALSKFWLMNFLNSFTLQALHSYNSNDEAGLQLVTQLINLLSFSEQLIQPYHTEVTRYAERS